ncbi:MAG: DUF3343 domain-containing protein [Fibrobacter sp.]|nr:DUF3343 domain-containing protein [Fibrobacter sp.]
MRTMFAIFHSTRGVVRANRACTKKSIPCKVIPVPREYSSECGMALEFDETVEREIKKVLEEEMLVAEFHKK